MTWFEKIHNQLASAKAEAFATGKRGNESGIQRSFMRLWSTQWAANRLENPDAAADYLKRAIRWRDISIRENEFHGGAR